MGKPLRSKVFVPNMGHHDYSKAVTYGEIIALTQGRPNIFSVDNLTDQIERTLKYAEDGDYILPSGNVVPNSIAIHYMLKRFGKCKLLIWVGNRDEYTVITLKD